jgi:hypothetical protein
MTELTRDSLKKLWHKEKDSYRSVEIGSGVQKFVKNVLKCTELFDLNEGKLSIEENKRKNEFLEETSKKTRRADVVIFIDGDIIIPVEVEKYGNIEAGEKQLRNYQADWIKKYGILTDGNKWRFYNNTLVERTFLIDDILDDPTDLLTFWIEYTTPEYYYRSFFEKKGQQPLFNEHIPHLDEVREDFFKDITKLIENFKNKLNLKGYFKDVEDKNEREKKAVEITYAYLIQFILYKTLVDNSFADFENDWNERIKSIDKSIKNDSYTQILVLIKGISAKISKNIYKRFNDEQKIINNHLEEILEKPKNAIGDVSVWLDILLFINRYNFCNVENEIFGYVYENYLKDLYLNEKKGQYFTDPYVVDFMLDQIGYKPSELKKRYDKENDSISIIDPSCGSGTFLYNATNRLVNAFFKGDEPTAKLAEQLINDNIFGLDIAEFPLYLAEMNILMQMLPLVINEQYANPVEQKLKAFKTRDSISEFLDTAIRNTLTDAVTEKKRNNNQISFFTDALDLGYKSHMRDKDDLWELKNSLENRNGIPRFRFDYVIGNPPYVGYNQCAKQNLLFFEMIKEHKVLLSDVYGVNLHSVEGYRKVNRPNPNLYLFFIALGIALLKDDGKLSYIIPQTLLTAGDFDVMRFHLSKFITIEKIIVFTNAMFVGRGIKQKNKVATSSLIFIISKLPPTLTHSIEVLKHNGIYQDVAQSIKEIKKGENVTKSKISQQVLLKNFKNWNFLLFDKKYSDFLQDYKRNSLDIEHYYKHILADQFIKNRFYFDGGYSIDESIRLEKPPSEDYYIYPKFDSKSYTKVTPSGYWPNIRKGNSKYIIKLRQANQEYHLLDSPYKIVWSYVNPRKFYFIDKKIIWARNQYNAIGSDNKDELLYLFAVLSSPLNWTILINNVRSENEKDVLFSITAIKNFIQVPVIKKHNINIKQEVITLTQELLNCENLNMADIVEFDSILQQKFDSVEVKGSELVICYKNNCINCKIKDKSGLIQHTINEQWASLVDENGIGSISELKKLPVIDFERQRQLKDYIDDLVFSLYFKVKLPEIGFSNRAKVREACAKHKYYKLINKVSYE